MPFENNNLGDNNLENNDLGDNDLGDNDSIIWKTIIKR